MRIQSTTLVLLLSSVLSLFAQYSENCWTVDGGGGTSRDGYFSVTDTIGQPDAATWGDEAMCLEGGFWSGLTGNHAPSNVSLLSATVEPGKATIRMTGIPGAIYRLEYTTDLVSPSWSAVPASEAASGSSGTCVLTDANPTGPQRFYRAAYVGGP
jgi:hypothetical protein